MKPRVLFITGTGTGVGKTVVTALLVKRLAQLGRAVLAAKPLCSGGREDARILYRAQSGRLSLDDINPWAFRDPLSPAIAATRERRLVTIAEVEAHLTHLARRCEILVVEGAGGLLSPLGGRTPSAKSDRSAREDSLDAAEFASLDLIQRCRASTVIVARNQLGALNDVLLAWKALSASLRSRCVVLLSMPARIQQVHRSNLDYLQRRLGRERVVKLPFLPNWPDCLGEAQRLPRGVVTAIDSALETLTLDR